MVCNIKLPMASKLLLLAINCVFSLKINCVDHFPCVLWKGIQSTTVIAPHISLQAVLTPATKVSLAKVIPINTHTHDLTLFFLRLLILPGYPQNILFLTMSVQCFQHFPHILKMSRNGQRVFCGVFF